MGRISADAVPPVTTCLHCGSGPLAFHRVGVRRADRLTYHGRGLCGASYRMLYRKGALADYPTIKRGYGVLWEDWRELEARGYTRDHAAERLGISRRHLERVIARYREAVAA